MKPYLLAVAFVVGGVVGYAVNATLTVAPAPEVEEKVPRSRGAIADVGVLREKRVEVSQVVITNMVTTTNVVGGFNGPRGNPREWLERLKKEDPARFAQMTNRFAQWRQRRQERRMHQADFLASIDTSHMSAGAKKTHDALQELLAHQEELEEKLHQEDLSEDDRHALMEEMRETHHKLRQLNGEERSNLLTETARVLGYEGDDAKEITETISEIIDATNDGGRGMGGPPPGSGGGGAPGGGQPGGGGAPGAR